MRMINVWFKKGDKFKRLALPCPFCIMREDNLEIKQQSENVYGHCTEEYN